MNAVLSVRNVTYIYPGMKEPALRNISIDIPASTITCIIGPNGSGKSTLLLIMAGLLKPTRGEVYYMGAPLIERLPEARRRFGVLFQNPEIMMINPTVYDEIAYGPRQLYDEKTTDEKVRKTAELLGITHLLDRPTVSLSFGEKKLVALASILSYDPEILLLDEPFSNLHPEKKRIIKDIIEELVIEGKTIVITSPGETHEDIRCERKIYIENGRIV